MRNALKKTPSDKLCEGLQIQSEADAKKFVDNVRLNWQDGNFISSPEQFNATARACQYLDNWDLWNHDCQDLFNKIHPKDIKPLFNAMQGDKNFSFFFSNIKPYCVIRRVKDGKLFKTSNLSPEWIERVKQQIGDDECDVIANQDKDVGIGKLKVRRLMLHDKNNSSITLEHPQSL